MMKKKISIVLILMMVMGCFAGCGRKSEKPMNDAQVNGNTTYVKDSGDGRSSTTEGKAVDVENTYGGDQSILLKENAATGAECDVWYDYNGINETPQEPGMIAPEGEFNTEEYNAMEENGYKSVKNYPISTFSVDVDTASYSNLRRMIQQDGYIDTGAVRIEEMINYFSYNYAKPTGDHPFAVTTELSDCPWNKDTKLMLVGIQTEQMEFAQSPASNLVFLIDVSGSMFDDNKLPLVQKSFSMLTENLTAKDKVSIVVYAGEEAVILEGANGTEKERIIKAINQLSAGGSTAGSKGIETAYAIAEKNFIKDGNNRVILATDGDLNVGLTSESELEELITRKKESGVFLSVLGFGQGNYKDNKMELLADKGNGNYSYIDSLLEANKVLVEEMGSTLYTVAKDAKIQVEFNPNTVKGYRLIGYENRLLATEDFEDDTKDAGEVGAGHSVTAIYEIALSNSALEIPSTNLKYQEETISMNQDELLTISIRYKKPDKDTSILMTDVVHADEYSANMPKNLKFAAAVAEFGMLLRDSKYKGTATFDGIIARLADEDFSQDPYRKQFVDLVFQAKYIMMKQEQAYYD